jgi:uncharacterized protein YceK
MKQAVKATVLVLFVSLLSGCSSAEENSAQSPEEKFYAQLCEGAVETYDELIVERDKQKAIYDKVNSDAQAAQDVSILEGRAVPRARYQEAELKAALVQINNPSCFPPLDVAEAQIWLQKNR